MKGWSVMKVNAWKDLAGRARVGTRALSLGLAVLMLGVVGAAPAQLTPWTVSVTTGELTGRVGDTLAASVVETGVRTGARVSVTLRFLDSAGAVLAQTTGVVSADTPLRLVHTAPTAGAVRAEALILVDGLQLSAGVVSFERWNADDRAPPRRVCVIPTFDPTSGTPEPVTTCGGCLFSIYH